jgi:hypothetical protein
MITSLANLSGEPVESKNRRLSEPIKEVNAMGEYVLVGSGEIAEVVGRNERAGTLTVVTQSGRRFAAPQSHFRPYVAPAPVAPAVEEAPVVEIPAEISVEVEAPAAEVSVESSVAEAPAEAPVAEVEVVEPIKAVKKSTKKVASKVVDE